MLITSALKRWFPHGTTYLTQWRTPASRDRANRGPFGWNVLKYYRPWKRSQGYAPFEGPIQDREPWITFGARDFLHARLRSDMMVFEFGSGGSTLFFADRVRRVISVENDVAWATSVRRLLEREGNDKVDLKLVEGEALGQSEQSDPANPAFCHSASKNYSRYSFCRYVSAIDRFPDETFDVILVDGRARAACLHRSACKVRRGGILVLDNSDRAYYTENINPELKKWEQYVFYGPIPYLEQFIQTTCWVRPKAASQS